MSIFMASYIEIVWKLSVRVAPLGLHAGGMGGVPAWLGVCWRWWVLACPRGWVPACLRVRAGVRGWVYKYDDGV